MGARPKIDAWFDVPEGISLGDMIWFDYDMACAIIRIVGMPRVGVEWAPSISWACVPDLAIPHHVCGEDGMVSYEVDFGTGTMHRRGLASGSRIFKVRQYAPFASPSVRTVWDALSWQEPRGGHVLSSGHVCQ